MISREEFREISSEVAAKLVEGLDNTDLIEDLECISSFALILGIFEHELFDEKEK